MKNLFLPLGAVVSTALGFVRENAPESCTRLCAVLCCLTGCTIGVATVEFARANPSQAASITALGVLASGFIAGGTVSLLARKRKAFTPQDAATPEPGGDQ